jgi:LAS superfamily LD-carboxypeptidase LdcB
MKREYFMAILGASAILLAVMFKFTQPNSNFVVEPSPQVSFGIDQDSIAKNTPIPNGEDCPKPAIAAKPASLNPPILHFKYPEAKSNELVNIGNDEYLHRDAAKALTAMQNAAAKERVYIKVISAFRSVNEQSGIISRKKNQGLSDSDIYNQSSAPGYSEHHTGYAFDANDLNPSFGNTKTGLWLRNNSEKFGFEMSFDKVNFQNIAYEPWHFRYVGTAQAAKTFCFASKNKLK